MFVNSSTGVFTLTLTEIETHTETNKMGGVPNEIGSRIGLGLSTV